MNVGPLPSGKLPVRLLRELLTSVPTAGDVRLGPAVGEDAAVIDVPGGALVAATDPITLTGSDVGRYAVVVNANDVAVMGVRPRWFLATILLPVGTTTDDVRALFASIAAALAETGAALVGGHTEVTSAVTQPVVVGQMLGLAEDGRVLTTGGAKPGDVVVQVGPVPIEGAAVLAAEAGGRLGDVDAETLRAATAAATDPGISVVDAALAATALGATALHDPTEGGLVSGLHELATAAAARVTVDLEAVELFEPGRRICAALGADPLATLASGALLATFPTERAEAAVETLRTAGNLAAVIGVVEAGSGVFDRRGAPMPWPERDEVARILGG